MGRRSSNIEEEDAEVSMSPLIDCVFLLLIFFLVSTMMKKINKDIEIDLPLSESAEKRIPSNNQIVIGIDPEGALYIDGEETSIMDLHRSLREQTINNPEFQIRIDTDQAAPLHKVVEIVDLCQFNHLNDVVLRTYDEHYNRK